MIKQFIFVIALGIAFSIQVALAADSAYPPGLMFSTVLNGCSLLHEDGQFRLNDIQAVFLPDPKNGEYYPYNPRGGAALWTIIRTASGEELWRLDWNASVLKNPYWLLDSYDATNLKTGETSNAEWMDFARPGDYVLDFYLDSGKFYTFPFSISMIAAPDPFAGGDYYFLGGEWADWAYFYYYDAKPEQSIAFKVWLNNYAHEDYRDVKPLLEVKRGGQLICTSRPHMTYSLKPQWNRFEMDLISPMEGTSGGGYFKAQDLLATDGDYVLTLKFDSELYGTWKFTIKDHKFVPTGRTVRGEADPLTFIEGGVDAFWYKKQ